MLSVFARGLALGLAIAAPVGPIGVLVIRRTLAEGRLAGLVSGLGAATADGVYGFIAAFGLTLISSLLISQQGWIRLLGNYVSTFALTLTNPMTILSFAAVFAGLGVGAASGDYASAAILVLGVFLGSALWWLALSGAVSLLSGRVTPRGLRWVNRVSGVIILGFGVAALASLVA